MKLKYELKLQQQQQITKFKNYITYYKRGKKNCAFNKKKT